MLAIVEHQQQLALTEMTDDRVDRRAMRLVEKSQRANHRDRYAFGIGDRREVDIPDVVAELAGHLDC